MIDLRRFRTHVEILRHRHPELISKLIPDRKRNPVELILDGGEFRIKWNQKFLHSAKDPALEAARILEQVKFEPGRAYVVFGLGVGHLARGALSILPQNSALIVLEPDIRILREVLAAVDFRQMLFDPRLFLVSGRDWHESFRNTLRRCHDEGYRPATAVLALPAYRTYFDRALDDMRRILAQYLNERDIDKMTRQKLWELWNRNLTQNVPELLTAAPVRNFTTTFRDVPAVLVGAGPSLDSHLKDLPKLKEHALILAVDTALGPMLASGCEPDLVMALDAQEENATDFSELPEHQSMLLFDAFCFPSIPKSYPPRRRFASATGHIFMDFGSITVLKNGLLPMLEFLLDTEIGFLQNGGSVLTAGFDLARLSNCSALCLAGVDLAYPGYRTHSLLTQRFKKQTGVRNRYLTPESDFYEEFSQKARMQVDSAAGGKVWSDRVLVMYKQWMEESAARAGMPCFALGRSRGAALKGYEPVDVDGFLSKYRADRKDIDARLSRCRNLRLPVGVSDVRGRLEGIRRDLAGLDGRPCPARIGPFQLDEFVKLASFEISERLHAVLEAEPESQHRVRREQASRVARQFVIPFLDAVEESLNKI